MRTKWARNGSEKVVENYVLEHDTDVTMYFNSFLDQNGWCFHAGHLGQPWTETLRLPETNSDKALKKGNNHIPTIHFQVRTAVSFREGNPN